MILLGSHKKSPKAFIKSISNSNDLLLVRQVVNYSLRFVPAIIRLKELLSDGFVGADGPTLIDVRLQSESLVGVDNDSTHSWKKSKSVVKRLIDAGISFKSLLSRFRLVIGRFAK